ncbi:hemerythrin HHE cation binding domain-containing protein [Paucimonas lemoignei]|uniref:Hemerythrin HHE cation binding domain-containing protein n=1 Tax=Paucimonas lemoignei TaxID=29443 RepID=A0A4R3HVY9_PAULE|nr:hemerythrin domain-containing protein [Paucimonas lemoignei]TCS36245.1 hemerythrin HHE cation binding domain-containing protein [Paucimonas lemoignei]
MNALTSKLSPSITNMIRMDHTTVLATFHQYDPNASDNTKQALVQQVCLALEIHAQLEEEIFYPEMRSVAGSSDVLTKSVPEHDEMRKLIARLRSMTPDDLTYDSTFMELMRDVMHHVADEETVLLPEAERLLADRLNELGAQMTKRRLQLMAPHSGEIAMNTMRTMPASSMLMAAGALLAGGYLLKRSRGWQFRRHM